MNPPPVPSGGGGGRGGAKPVPLPSIAEGGGAPAEAVDAAAAGEPSSLSLVAPSADRIQNPFLAHGHAGKLPFITKDLIGKTVDVSDEPFDRRSTMCVKAAVECLRAPPQHACCRRSKRFASGRTVSRA